MTRAETVARTLAQNWYSEMSPEWHASFQRIVAEALVAFGREAAEAMRERAAKWHDSQAAWCAAEWEGGPRFPAMIAYHRNAAAAIRALERA